MVKTDTTRTTIVTMAAASPPHTSHAMEAQKAAGTIAKATVSEAQRSCATSRLAVLIQRVVLDQGETLSRLVLRDAHRLSFAGLVWDLRHVWRYSHYRERQLARVLPFGDSSLPFGDTGERAATCATLAETVSSGPAGSRGTGCNR